MYSSKLVDVFYALSKSQQRALRKVVRSPYFNRREDVSQLFDLMYKTPLTNRQKLRKEQVFKVLYPNETYAAEKVDHVMSFLFKIIEHFLIQEYHINSTTSTQLTLLKVYQQLGLNRQFKRLLTATQKWQNNQTIRDIDYHEHTFAVELKQYEFLAQQRRGTAKNLQELSTKLDLRFLAQKLKNGCALLAHQAVYNKEYDFGLLDLIIPYIEAHPTLLENPAIAIYYYYYLAVTTSPDLEEDYFQSFKMVFLNSTHSFEQHELEDIYTLALNYCVKKVNVGALEYQHELFEIYELGLQLGILLNNGILNQFKFLNIAKLALRLEKIEWTKNFIETYKSKVTAQYQDSYVHAVYSMLYFAQGKYQETLLRLQQVDYKDLFITLDAKVMQTKIYYQLDEYDALESSINSFKVFLRRKEIMAYHQEIYKNFTRYLQKLINLPLSDKAAKKKLYHEIEQTPKLPEKKWLLEQLS